jgi:hypothetical protein
MNDMENKSTAEWRKINSRTPPQKKNKKNTHTKIK